MGALLGMLLYLRGVEKNTEQVRQRPSLGRPTGLPALAMPLHYTATCTRVFSPDSIMRQEAPTWERSWACYSTCMVWRKTPSRSAEASLGRPRGLPALAMPLHYTATCTRVFSPQFYNATGGPYMGALLGMI